MRNTTQRTDRGTTAPPPPRAYRRDVDGLRGLAIALVVIFHVFVGRVSSGVDVFLLIGGVFFFGPQIRNALNPAGQTLVQSVSRLMRRLYPALLTVVTVTLLAALAVYSPARWPRAAADAAASLLYYQNLHLARQGEDYAAVGQDVSLYQHIWSMAVQLQIYLGSLIVITVLALLMRRLPRTVSAVTLYGVLVTATIASFIYAIHLNGTDQGLNYYSPFSRFWEIGLGGLVGMVMINSQIPARLSALRWPAGVVGLALIIGTGLFLDGAAQFPGPWTLVPLTGAALVILAGNPPAGGGPAPAVGVTALLGTAPFQTLGRMAYSLYLWHWPLLVLATFQFATRADADVGGPGGILATLGFNRGILAGVAVIIASLVLATLTERYVETPLRQARRPERSWLPMTVAEMRRPTEIMVAIGTVAVTAGVLAFGPYVTERERQRVHDEFDVVVTNVDNYPGPAALLDDAPVPDDVPVLPASADIRDFFAETGADGCAALFEEIEPVLFQDRNESDVPCAYGDRESERTMYLAGSSHAEHFLPALDIIGRERGIRIIPMLKMGCGFGLPLPRADGQPYPECEVWNDNALAHILENPPTDGVFLIATRPENLDGRGPDHVPGEYVDLVGTLTGAGIHTWGMRDTPWLRTEDGNVDSRLCVADGRYRAGDPDRDCGIAREGSLLPVNPAIGPYEGLDITLLDVTEGICDGERCPGVVGNVLVYRDSSHLTNVYAAKLAPEIMRQMYGNGA